jgi:hypothetical protein
LLDRIQIEAVLPAQEYQIAQQQSLFASLLALLLVCPRLLWTVHLLQSTALFA